MTPTPPVLKPLPPDPNAIQRAASDPVASVWVNASAGSGKTSVLTKRVTRLLLSGVRPERLLCLTYTRAGAAEMANRVTTMLSKWAVCDDAVLEEDLFNLQNAEATQQQITEARRLFARVLACPGGLRIRTIHSFCQEILSRFPIEAGLPPHFALIDDNDLEILREETLNDLLREADKHPDQPLAQALATLVAAQGEDRFDSMLREVTRAHARLSKAMTQAGGEEALIARLRDTLDLAPTDTAEDVRRAVMENLPEESLKQIALWLSEGGKTNKKTGQALADILARAPHERAAYFDTYKQVFLTQKNEPRAKLADKEVQKKYPHIDDVIARLTLQVQETLTRLESIDYADITTAVIRFGHAFAQNLAVRKARRAALDYDDLILFTERLLQKPGISPWILYKLDNGLDHILVDEAQDTSRTQWNIVQALTGEFYAGEGARDPRQRTLFVVGDEKQSIFSFQNADPEGFLLWRDFYARHLFEAGADLKRIGMHISFRSAPAILKAVDEVFRIDSARAGVSQDLIEHTAAPNKDGSAKTGRVEIWPLLTADKEEKNDDRPWTPPSTPESDSDPEVELTQQIARKIKTWLERGETLPGFARPIAAGDIMILLRRRGAFANLMVRALKTHNVPVTGVDRMHLVKQLPVMDLLAMLRFVLLPDDDLNLACLLRSPLLGLSEEDLMQLAIGRTGSLWDSLRLTPAFAAAHAYLQTQLAQADSTTVFTFLSRLLNSPCPANATSGRRALWTRLGDESLDPIEELLNAAQNFGRGHAPSLQNFLHWLTQSDAEIKRELDHGGGQVRIMTVHAAKGLEAPIVFLPDTTALPRSTDLDKLQWSKDEIPLFLPRQPSGGMAADLWEKARVRQMAEYRRLFYVALTRAAHRLYICGWQGAKANGDPAASWYGLASAALQSEHQEHAVSAHDLPLPLIAFADHAPPVAAVPATPAHVTPPVTLPPWATRPIEPLPTARLSPNPDTPDSSAATPDAAFARGRIIHRLLQSLPDIAPPRRADSIARFLAHPRHALTAAGRDEIASEVTGLLNDPTFAALFATNSLAEVPLTGSLDGVPVFRQIDRLCLHGDEVWIVDYKTNRPPPLLEKDIPASYRNQLGEYRTLLRGIYPDKRIRCFLLWTYAPRLMEITF